MSHEIPSSQGIIPDFNEKPIPGERRMTLTRSDGTSRTYIFSAIGDSYPIVEYGRTISESFEVPTAPTLTTVPENIVYISPQGHVHAKNEQATMPVKEAIA